MSVRASGCVNIYVCVCVHVCVCVCCMRLCVRICVCWVLNARPASAHVVLTSHAPVCVCVCVCVCQMYTRVHLCACVCACERECMHITESRAASVRNAHISLQHVYISTQRAAHSNIPAKHSIYSSVVHTTAHQHSCTKHIPVSDLHAQQRSSAAAQQRDGTVHTRGRHH